MSTAVLISGQLRTFAKCYPTQRWHVLRHFEDPHFFITVQDEPGLESQISSLKSEWGADRVHCDQRADPDLSAHLTPEITAAYHRAPYTNAAPAHQLLLQHWYQNECWKHFQHVGASLATSRDTTIIRLRADLWFHSMDWDSEISNSESQIASNECWTPWWGRFGGINDRFAIMGPEAAKYYFTVWDHIPELLAAGCPFHPETLLRAAIERADLDHFLHETLRTEFSTLRLNGQMRHWTSEVLTADLAHAALRAA